MATRYFLIGIVALITARAEFISESMGNPGTNTVINRGFIVTSNWFFASGFVAGNRGFPAQTFVYARPRPGAGKAAQWIAPEAATQEFGVSMALGDGVLAVKDALNTYFFREENGQWNPDGKMETGMGPLLIDGELLISGSTVYRWPSREFVQTLNAPGVMGTPWAVTMVGSRLAMSFAPEGVWSFDYDYESERFLDGARIPQPEGSANTGFGATLANWAGADLIVGAPQDDTKGADAGAAYVYRWMDPDGWRSVQKLTAALGMAGDQFGSTLATDERRIYIAAPFRNEAKQQSGAIFIYEMPEVRGVYVWLEKERIAQRDGTDFGRLGWAMTAHNRMIYASAGGDTVALHPAMQITFSRQGERSFIGLPGWDRIGTLESTDDLHGSWDDQPATQNGSTLEAASTSPARFFRMRLEPAF